MVRFLQDPTGDMPWEEEATSTDIVHIDNQPVSDTPTLTVTPFMLCRSDIACIICQSLPFHYSSVTPLSLLLSDILSIIGQ